jgi:copper chaperone CopZ
MKKTFFIAVILTVCAFGINAQSKKDNSNAQKSSKSEVTFHIGNMHGEHCKQIISENIAFEKGVKDLIFDLEKQNLTIVYNGQKTNVETLGKSLEKLGYEVKELKAAEECRAQAVEKKSCCRSH